jgi:SAM-dependent methyltransferase
MGHDASANDRQYGNSGKLAARARLHQLYSRDEAPWFPWVAAKAELRPGDHVLDIGCGPGWLWVGATDALPSGLHLTLADLSAGMVEEALPRVRALDHGWTIGGEVADIAALPFSDGAFDAVIAMHMLYHVPDQQKAIAEALRVLKPGGRLVVTTNGLENLRELYALSAAAFGVSGRDPAAELFGFGEAETLLRAAFGNVEVHRYPGRLRITDPEHVFEAQTSYPPGEDAPEPQLAVLRAAIAAAFEQGGGVLEVAKETGAFISRKPD